MVCCLNCVLCGCGILLLLHHCRCRLCAVQLDGVCYWECHSAVGFLGVRNRGKSLLCDLSVASATLMCHPLNCFTKIVIDQSFVPSGVTILFSAEGINV